MFKVGGCAGQLPAAGEAVAAPPLRRHGGIPLPSQLPPTRHTQGSRGWGHLELYTVGRTSIILDTEGFHSLASYLLLGTLEDLEGKSCNLGNLEFYDI